MHKVVKAGLGTAVAFGLVVTGALTGVSTATATPTAPATAPTDRAELVELIPGLSAPVSYVLSSDYTKMYTLEKNWAPGSIVDLATRTVIGTFPTIPGFDSVSASDDATVASGDLYVAATFEGYAIVNLATGVRTEFPVWLPGGERVLHYSITAAGAVTAISSAGNFLTFEGSTASSSTQIAPDPLGTSPVTIYKSGVTSDGSRFFIVSDDVDPETGYNVTTTIIGDAHTGEILHTVLPSVDSVFSGEQFDVTGEALWGTYGSATAPETVFVGVDIATGAFSAPVPTLSGMSQLWLADAAHNSVIILDDWLHVGQSTTNSDVFGTRKLLTADLPTQIPGSRDVVFLDDERNVAGIVTGQEIVDPVDVPVAKLGDTVTFSSTAEGLAIEADDEWLEADSPRGSIWQSSSNGTDWADIAGSTGTTLDVTVTAENANTQYRRHFADGFWGGADSAPARAIGQPPAITRADDLPQATVGTTYPDEVITATGQADLVWSVGSPDTRAVAQGLPAGLTLDPATGTIGGTPTALGEHEFTITVQDAFGTDSKAFRLNVVADKVDPEKPDPEKPEPVKPKPGTKTPGLANTGADSALPALGVTALLVAAGAAALALARRKRSVRS